MELYDTKENTRKLEKKLEETTRKLEEKFEETTRKLLEKVTALENRIMQGLEEHKWKISGFSEILRQAKSREKTILDSAPFYTRKFGYKFKIRLYPDGESNGESTHLSIYFILMKGEYDATLPWPFKENVTFTLIDQQEDENDKKNIVTGFLSFPKNSNNRSAWNAKPVIDENIGRGFSRFVSHNELSERRFILDDTIIVLVKFASPERCSSKAQAHASS